MNLAKYQTEAAVTICCDDKKDMAIHAVLGLVAEMGEFLNALCFDKPEHTQKEIGDVCWMIAELCTANTWKMQDVVSLEGYDKAEANPSALDDLCGIYQKTFQGHGVNEDRVKLCIRQVWALLMNCCATQEWWMPDLLDMNINKLRKRYPEGFKAENSLHRAEGDI